MVPRLGLASIALAVLTYFAAAQVEESAKIDPARVKEDVSLREKQIAAKFQEFEQLVLRLKQRLALSPVQADRDQAAALDRVLEYCKDRSISVTFEQILEDLKSKDLKSTTEIDSTLSRVRTVADDLKNIVAMLREDTRSKGVRDKMEMYKKLIEDLERVIRNQQAVQGQTQNNKTEKDELKNLQKDVTKKTGDISAKLDGKDNPKNAKGADKSPGKNGEEAAKSKSDGEKSGDKSPDNAQAKEDGKDGGKEGDPKSGGDKKDGSPAQAKGSDSKGGGKDGGKEGDSKSGSKSPDNAQAKDGGKSGDPKSGDPKAGDPKSGDPKSGDPAQAKDGGPKSGDPKSGDPKSGAQAKSGDPKSGDPRRTAQAKGSKGDGSPSESKSGSPSSGKPGSQSSKAQAKSGPSSKGQSEAKGDGSQSPMPPSQSGPPAQAKSGSQSPPPPSGDKKDDAQIAKKQIQEGQQKQQEAEDKIEQGKNDQASDDQNAAIKKLEDAKKELERLLRQLREEEIERVLAQLQQRCEKMLAMQQMVLAGTERVDKLVTATADKTATREHKQDSLKLSDNEGDIVVEATRAIEILEAEGSALAFPEVFQQVREDMKHVQRRLGVTDVAKVTQEIEIDIIDTLKEMIEALKKKRQENQSKPSPSGPPPPPQDQKLLDKIAELKMIRAMQVRVNGRTQLYGKQYNGEQAAEPAIRRELHGLSDRQERIFEVTNRMARGDNK